MFKRPHYAALAAVVFATLVLLNLPSRTSSHLKLLFSGLFLPLFGLAGSAQSAVDRGAATLVPRSALLEQIDRLTTENERLRIEATALESLRKENAELRQLVQWRPPWTARYRLAAVVGRDTANWWRSVEINLGSRDGLRTNLAVLTPDGLVGRIGEVGFDRSRVILLGDQACRVSAVVEESRDQGVIEPGNAFTDRSLVLLTYLPNTGQVRPGHRVGASGLGGVFPRGALIGRVVDTRSVGNGLYTEARVKLAVNLDRLERVWVMLP